MLAYWSEFLYSGLQCGKTGEYLLASISMLTVMSTVIDGSSLYAVKRKDSVSDYCIQLGGLYAPCVSRPRRVSSVPEHWSHQAASHKENTDDSFHIMY